MVLLKPDRACRNNESFTIESLEIVSGRTTNDESHLTVGESVRKLSVATWALQKAEKKKNNITGNRLTKLQIYRDENTSLKIVYKAKMNF